MADKAERRPVGGTGAQDGGEHVRLRIAALGCPCGCKTRLPWFDDPGCIRHRPLSGRGLDEALDHFHRLGVCVCWTVPRQHPRRAA